MSQSQPRNPLYGITLEQMPIELVDVLKPEPIPVGLAFRPKQTFAVPDSRR
jgi:hypothetical protein